jgi:hypothetical protein
MKDSLAFEKSLLKKQLQDDVDRTILQLLLKQARLVYCLELYS